MSITYLPLLGSGFAPVDSMSAGVRCFGEHQPFTPLTQTLRGRRTDTSIGTSGAPPPDGVPTSPRSDTCGPGRCTDESPCVRQRAFTNTTGTDRRKPQHGIKRCFG
jgi:hypothetical protein